MGDDVAQIPASPRDVRPILIRDRLPKMTLMKVDGAPCSLIATVARKPTVLVFYRGGW